MIEYNKEIKLSETLHQGYLYFCDLSHPLSFQGGRVYFHRHVASLMVGRWLRKDEVIHHIDGNKLNNFPDNILIVSNSEHVRIHAAMLGKTLREDVCWCIACGNKLSSVNGKTGLCPTCYCITTRKFNITKAELKQLVWEKPTTEIASVFSVTDKAIERRCKLLQIEKPPRGYWSKIRERSSTGQEQ